MPLSVFGTWCQHPYFIDQHFVGHMVCITPDAFTFLGRFFFLAAGA